MFTDRNFCAGVAAVALTIALGVAESSPIEARTTATRVLAPRVLAPRALLRTKSPRTIPAPGTINTLYSFTGGADGANPQGGLQYGLTTIAGQQTTTIFGAAQGGGSAGDGTIFSIGTQAAAPLNVVYTFSGQPDGAAPADGLFGQTKSYSITGPFVGVTSAGGQYGYGAIYTVTANGAETVLYSFTGRADGATPVGKPLLDNGVYYGTTSAGGRGYGTIYRFNPANGRLVTVHTFSNSNDGAAPLAGLSRRIVIPATDANARTKALNGGRTIDANQPNFNYGDVNLYGTTSNGGAKGTGDGTLFKFNPNTSTLTTLYTFTDSATNPGATPQAAVVTDFSGNLYGTTEAGGSAGQGEVFEYSSAGVFSVIHDFGIDPVYGLATTGANPVAPLTVSFNGNLYGTTSSGSANGLGNVFEISPSGFSLLYEFSGPDGATPEAGLVDGLNGNLYGTTSAGGAYGFGTIFAVAE